MRRAIKQDANFLYFDDGSKESLKDYKASQSKKKSDIKKKPENAKNN